MMLVDGIACSGVFHTYCHHHSEANTKLAYCHYSKTKNTEETGSAFEAVDTVNSASRTLI